MVCYEEGMVVVRGLVLSYVKQHRVPYDLWNDAFQEAYLRMLTVLPKYDSERGSIKTFLYTPTIGAVIDMLRHAEGYSRNTGHKAFVSIEHRREDGDPEFADCATHDVDDNPDAKYVRDVEFPRVISVAMRNLPPKERTVVELIYWNDKRLEDVAPVIGNSPTHVYHLKVRALKVMRETLKLAS